MRIPFFSMFVTSPFEGLQEHAEKVKDCALIFQQAIECRLSENCKTFQEFQREIKKLESEADIIKRRVWGHLPKGTVLPVDKFQIFRYIKEQDKVLDTVEDVLDWFSFKADVQFPEIIKKDIILLVDATIEPIEKLSKMMREARKYFADFSEEQRNLVKSIILELRASEHDADQIEKELKRKIFSIKMDAVDVFFMIRLVEYIGSIADYAENTGDVMRAMIAK